MAPCRRSCPRRYCKGTPTSRWCATRGRGGPSPPDPLSQCWERGNTCLARSAEIHPFSQYWEKGPGDEGPLHAHAVDPPRLLAQVGAEVRVGDADHLGDALGERFV